MMYNEYEIIKIDDIEVKAQKFKDINEKHDMIWLDDPKKYPYVRESNYLCASPNYKPIHKGEKTTFIGYEGGLLKKGKTRISKKGELRLIGYEKPKKANPNDKFPCVYHGIYFWLKSYDKGMPDGHLCYDHPDAPKWYKPQEAVTII